MLPDMPRHARHVANAPDARNAAQLPGNAWDGIYLGTPRSWLYVHLRA